MPLPPIKLYDLRPPDEPHVSGPAGKPETCRNCRLYTTTTGIVLDSIAPEHKIVLVFLCPTNDEINDRRPLAGNMGWFVKRTIHAAGIKEGSYGVSYLFRCFADSSHRDKYGKLKQATIDDGFSGCRAYDWSAQDGCGDKLDRGLRDWRPDVWLPTFEPAKGMVEPAFALLTRGDLQKAQILSEAGDKVAVVFGSPAMKKVMGWTADGGMRMWRGSAERFTWEPKIDRVGAKVDEKVMFREAPMAKRMWGRKRGR